VAWFASHRHTADGANEPYAYSYLFAYPLDVPAGATTLTLPDNEKIRILAISVAEEGATAKPVQPLYDTLERGRPPRSCFRLGQRGIPPFDRTAALSRWRPARRPPRLLPSWRWPAWRRTSPVRPTWARLRPTRSTPSSSSSRG